uniref:Hypotheticial protein n=1 Tax=Schistosoma japonicum TaxID=6182 RepID=C1LA76_SCHJA|nr:hypotheticial protein [Schistosoma japonicum]CAX71593.1 hypotheticial protein [Schistosoma japonicum]CAX71604.1 hypotheticial protein [Schistosoma japonicum]
MIMNSINTHKHLMLRFILICVLISCCYFNVVEMKRKSPRTTLDGLRYSR